MKLEREALRKNPDTAPPLETQFMDALAWDVEQSSPNVGSLGPVGRRCRRQS